MKHIECKKSVVNTYIISNISQKLKYDKHSQRYFMNDFNGNHIGYSVHNLTINAYKLLLYASGLPIDDKNTVKISVKEYAKLLNITNTTNVYDLLDKAVIQLMGVHINTTHKNKSLYFHLIRKGEIGQGYLHLIYEDEFVEYLKLSSISKINYKILQIPSKNKYMFILADYLYTHYYIKNNKHNNDKLRIASILKQLKYFERSHEYIKNKGWTYTLRTPLEKLFNDLKTRGIIKNWTYTNKNITNFIEWGNSVIKYDL